MIKTTGITLVIFIFSLVSASSKTTDIGKVRLQYIKAVQNPDAADELLAMLEAQKCDEPLIRGYKGAAQALIARYSWNPYNKLKYLYLSQETLESAIKESPDDPELRFLRFTIQHYVPAFLGLSRNLQEDKTVIISHISQTRGQVRQVIVGFMLECGRCNENERRALTNYL